MTAPDLPSFVDHNDVMAASRHLLDLECRALWQRWRPYAREHGAAPLSDLVDALLGERRWPDSARVRHFCHVTKAILRSYHQGSDPPPAYVSHFQLDSLAPGRLIELHTWRLLAALVSGRTDSDPDLSVELPGEPALPVSIDLGKAGMLEPAPEDAATPLRFEIAKGRIHLAPVGAHDLTEHEPVPGLRLVRPTRWRHSAPLFLTHRSGASFLAPVHDRGLREPYSATAPVVWHAPAVSRWLLTLSQALDRCAELDEAFLHECVAVTPEILPLYHGIGQQYGSASNVDVHGYTYLPGIERPLDVAECFVHEAMHQKLFRIESLVPLFEPDSPVAEAYYSPWRADPRPLRMVLHGCFVFAYVAWMWRRWSEDPPPEAPGRARSAELAFRRACEVLSGIDLLERYAKPTGHGRALLDEIKTCTIAQKDAVAISPEWRRQVNEDLAAHRQRHVKTSLCSDPITF